MSFLALLVFLSPCLLVFFLLSGSAHAQSIGPSIGYTFGVPLTVDRTPGVVNRYGSDRAGESADHAGSFGVALFAPRLLGDLGLSATFGLVLSVGNFTSHPFTFGSLFDPSTLDRVSPLQQFEISTTLGLLHFGAQARYAIAERWLAGVGPWMEYRLSSGFHQIERIIDHPEVTFDDGTRERVVAAGEILGATRLRYGLAATAAMRIPISEGIELQPEVTARIDVDALTDGIEIGRASRVGGGLALLFDLERSPTQQEDRPPPVALDASPTSRLAPSLRLYSITPAGRDTGAAIIRRRTVHQRRSIALVPAIFFDPHSSMIPARYVGIDARHVDTFSTTALVRTDPVALQRQVLNIIGWRLRRDPSSRITLRGMYASDETPGLARERTEGVASYLIERWGIAPTRITQGQEKSTTIDNETGRCVVIDSQSEAIVAPLLQEWRIRRLDAPSFGLEHTITAEAGLRGWRLTVSHGGEEVAHYSGENSEELEGIDLPLHLGPTGDGAIPPIEAELVIEDSTGATAHIDASLPLVLAPSSDESPREVITIEAILPGRFPAMDMKRETTYEEVDDIVRDLRNGARITLVGEGNHLDLIAARLLSALKANGVHLGEFHMTEPRETTTAATPEERILRSWPSITIEQGDDEQRGP